MSARTYFTTIAREAAEALSEASSEAAGSVSSHGSGSHAGSVVSSKSASSKGSGASRASSNGSSMHSGQDLGPPQTQMLLGSPQQPVAAKQVTFQDADGGSIASRSSKSGSDMSSHSSSYASEAEESVNIRRVLLHMCISAAIFAAVYNIAPLVAREKLEKRNGQLDKKKLLAASGVAALVGFGVARLVV